MGNIMISDKDGNVVPVAALKMNAGLLHAGNNVWRVSAFKQVTKEIINTVTNFFTVTRERSLTNDVVTNLETVTQPKPVSKVEATQRTRNALEEIEKTVTNVYMATRNQTRSVAASEQTATKPVSLTATVPEFSATDIVTRERTVTRFVGFGFLVTGPATITRGAAFNLDIQSYKTTNGQLDTTYVPLSIVQIDAALSDPLDDRTPYSTNNAGWSDGKKTVSVTVDGGADSDTVTFWIHDPNSSREGFLQIPIAPSATVIGFNDDQYYLELNEVNAPGTDDWDAGTDVTFRNTQVDAQANFEAENVLISSEPAPVPPPPVRDINALRRVHDDKNWIQMQGDVRAGYLRFAVTDPQKVGLKAVRLRTELASTLQTLEDDLEQIYEFSRYAWTRKLVLSPSEAGNTYPSGLAMKSMSPTQSHEFTLINQFQVNVGGDPDPATRGTIELEIPKSWIENLVGNQLYLWYYVVERDWIPYVSQQFRSTVGNEWNGIQREAWDKASNATKLVLYV